LRGAAYNKKVDDWENIYIYLNEDINIYAKKSYFLNAKQSNTGVFNSNLRNYTTGEDKYVGEFTITKLDTVNYIISGTFWFDAVSEDGEVVEIREGRFDIKDFCCLADPRYK